MKHIITHIEIWCRKFLVINIWDCLCQMTMTGVLSEANFHFNNSQEETSQRNPLLFGSSENFVLGWLIVQRNLL